MTDKLDAIPGSTGRKIIDGLKDAVAGNFASVTIEGQRWVRADAPPSRQPDFRTEVFQAAERANARYGQWMPQRWLEIFIGEMMKEPE